jgi:hypothetical protein
MAAWYLFRDSSQCTTQDGQRRRFGRECVISLGPNLFTTLEACLLITNNKAKEKRKIINCKCFEGSKTRHWTIEKKHIREFTIHYRLRMK